MRIQELYRWEAEKRDGTIINKDNPIAEKKDLSDCIRFSLIPAPGIPLPQHDIINVPMERHFARGIKKTILQDVSQLPGNLYWQDGATEMRTTEDWTTILKPGDLIGKGVKGDDWYRVRQVFSDKVVIEKPYKGFSKPNGMFCRARPNPDNIKLFIYLHCIVCRDFRIWINYENGAVLVYPKDQEVFL